MQFMIMANNVVIYKFGNNVGFFLMKTMIWFIIT